MELNTIVSEVGTLVDMGSYEAARKTSKKVINFFVVGLTYGCRRSWILIRLTPAWADPRSISR